MNFKFINRDDKTVDFGVARLLVQIDKELDGSQGVGMF